MKYRLILFKIGLKKGLASKYALLFYLVSALISLTVQYFLWKAVLAGKPVSEFKQTFSYLILMQLLAILFPKTSYDVDDKVRSGDIALDLLKPVTLATQLFWEGAGYSVAKLLIVGLVDVLIYLWVLDFQVTLIMVVMVAVAAALAYLLYFELELLLGLWSFYAYSIWGISAFKEAILLILAGNVFPAYFYPQALKTLAAYLPFQYSFGAVGLLAQHPTVPLFGQIIVIQLLYIALFALLFKLLYQHAVSVTVIQGG
ncbi:ABC-2 family transporter protein [Lactobacillus xylocopicola]|uniref:ABC transporter permease n=1 Tax=Lactobacillus xylocopicola TaxID=2976676 RepID=A0ABM8BEW4_9LACO|nr:ABC-2 family transporter protein [Lactobacillus xylocopicola]BDR59786.1 ABC transporter permease [Lactobacillus xylocopicola]